MPLILAQGLSKTYHSGERSVTALQGIDLEVKEGEFISVVGASGSGKSTLLHILGCLERPSTGRFWFDGTDILAAGDESLSALRARRIGFVFQMFNLLEDLDLYENVELPFHYGPAPPPDLERRVTAALERVGLSHRQRHRPSQLSGGEMQRAAIARALVTDPRLVLADEPTGNLDSTSSGGVMALFREMHQRGATVVLVTHDPAVAQMAQRVVHLHDGQLG